MNIEFCILQNFRIFSSIETDFSPQFNFLLGNNGSGKTSFLEGLSLLFSGRSLKNTADTILLQSGRNHYYAAGRIESLGNLNRIELEYKKYPKRKNLLLNKKRVSSFKELLRQFPFVSFLGEDIKIITEGPVFRRQFLDRMISYIEPSFYDSLMKYQKVIKQRNTLLKNKQTSQLEFWNEELSRLGFIIYQKRIEYAKLFNYSLEEFADLPHDTHDVKLQLPNHPESFEDFRKKIILNVDKDIQRGYTGLGPHRDDFPLLSSLGLLKNFASQGQIKTISFFLKLFQALFIAQKTSQKPVLLIDDIFAELDSNNRERVLRQVLDSGFQTFISSTNQEFSDILLKKAPGKVIQIEKGQIQT